jgi:hypothetical protein
MSDQVLNTQRAIEQLLDKKEFAQLRVTVDPNSIATQPKNMNYLDDIIAKEGRLFLHPQQQFVRNFLNPNTEYLRLLCKHDTGMGKTAGSLSAAFEFIKYYRQQFNLTRGMTETPLIFVIGFSKAVFQKELLRRPEFGFIDREEIKERKRLQYLAESGSTNDRDALVEYESRLKKRLTKKSRGGFFKFLGYKEFFNRLFTFSGEVPDNEEDILRAVKTGTITINMELVRAFRNSLIICDEIHNVYNSVEINNYGIALRVMFNLFDIPELMEEFVGNQIAELKHYTLRVIFLTATPINNNPAEIVDLLNLLVPQSRLPQQRKLRKEDFFSDERNLKPGALDSIEKLVRGYISFIRSQDPKYFPERVFAGEPLRIPPSYLPHRVKGYEGKFLPYLKFISCPMSPLHYKTYQSVYVDTLPPDGQSLMDLVLPNPGLLDPKIIAPDLGLYRSKDIKYSLQNASQKWKDQHQIDYIKAPEESGASIITGEFMRLPHLGKYCTKYEAMVKELLDNLKHSRGKVLIVHQLVKMSGVLFIREVLRKNGFIDEASNPTDDTLCSICGVRRSVHPHTHEFQPARFIMVHGEMDMLTRSRNIDRFNSPENTTGNTYRILLGSKILNEGVDLVAVENIYVMNVPPDIPTLIQIIGRAIRNKSHLALPPERRKVHIRIFISSLPKKAAVSALSYEENKYFEKLMDYIVIQQIERVFHANAIDAPLFRDVIFNPALQARKREPELGTLYFDVSPVFGKRWIDIVNHKTEISLKSLDTSTFYPFHSTEEIHKIIYTIKRCFLEQSSVWTYQDLWQMVRNPPFEVYVNPALFLEEDFLIALSVLCPSAFYRSLTTFADISTAHQQWSRHRRFIDRLFDPDDIKIVRPNMQEYRIFWKNGYFILLPIVGVASIDEYSLGLLGQDGVLAGGKPVLEVDSWYRRETPIKKVSLRITDSLRTSNISYNQMKYRFYNQFIDTPIEQIPTTIELYDLDFHVHLVEDAIRYVFNIYTNAKMPFSELHTFYFKILYFYDRLDMILFANQLDETKLYDHYKPYIETKTKIAYRTPKVKEALVEEHGYNAFLMSSISKSSEGIKFNIDRLNEFLGKRSSSGKHHPHLEDMDLDRQLRQALEHRSPTKIFANLLPVGHFLTSSLEQTNISTQTVSVPKIYLPENEGKSSGGENLWRRAGEFVSDFDQKSMVENDILIGYYEKNPSGIDVKFKMRPPIHRIEHHEDSRMIERGSACSTRHKEELVQIAKTLDLHLTQTETQSIKIICNIIKLELMRREMVARKRWKKEKRGKRVKWFYFHFERQIE